MIFNKNVNIVIAGEAGQGIDTATEVISKILHANNFNVFSLPEYMSRIRGGSNSALIRVSDEFSPCFSKKIDILFALDSKVFEHLKDRISPQTISLELKTKNFYIIGYICALFRLNLQHCLDFLQQNFENYSNEENIALFESGFSDGEKNVDIKIEIPADRDFDAKLQLSVNDALGLGFIAGGCNFIPFYPMSPSTFLQAFLIKYADEFGIIFKQVEDEICVMNMAIGAWYSGARAIACTSGGGFSLMCEGVSLAAMTESPIVINVAQRPGPATGLPTRTEQGDLNLALYSGHGEFPRIIFAPSTIEDAFKIGQVAFDSADKFQVPVFVLTDQSVVDSVYASKELVPQEIQESYIVKSTADYKRYKLSNSPISLRSIPNYGEGIVCVDSDEHDEIGNITEDFSMRKQMVEKRMGKLDLIKTEILEPYFVGEQDYKTLIVSWGSNYNVIKEAIKDKKDFALLHFVQLYPLSDSVINYVKMAKKVVLIEQNYSGEFGNLLKLTFGIDFDKKLLKYSGEPFAIEDIASFLETEGGA